MSYQIKGILHKKFETESKSDTFQARDFVIKTEGDYPQFIKLQLTQDRCDVIENYNENDKVNVFFDVRGREWNEKFFTNLNAWKVEKDDSQPVNGNIPQTRQEAKFDGSDEDLPF